MISNKSGRLLVTVIEAGGWGGGGGGGGGATCQYLEKGNEKFSTSFGSVTIDISCYIYTC